MDTNGRPVFARPLSAVEAADFLGVKPRHFYNLPIPFLDYGPKCHRWEMNVLDEYKARCRALGARHLVLSGGVDAELQRQFRKVGATGKPTRRKKRG
ncbi:MAG: hypothetical protein JWN94_3521 [Betaproteobacteria bacterium]|nr:hypothetical protein [Betaproteobacteria bacterium]